MREFSLPPPLCSIWAPTLITPACTGEDRFPLHSLLSQMLSSWKHLQDTPRNNVFSAIQAFLSPIKLKYEINHHTHFIWVPFKELAGRTVMGKKSISCFVVVVVQSLSPVWLFVTPWTAACQAPLSFTISWSWLRFMSFELMMLSNHLILCRLLLPSIFPSIRVSSNESTLRIRWPKYWSFSYSISPSNEYSGLIFFKINWVWSPCCPRDSQE